MATALDPRIAADLGPTWTGQSGAFTAKLVAMDGTVLASGLAFNEPSAGSGRFRVTTPTDTSAVGTIYYDGTGLTPPIPWLPSDPITVLAAGVDPNVAAIKAKTDQLTFNTDNHAVNANVVNVVVTTAGFSLTIPGAQVGPPISNVPAERPICIAAQTDLPFSIPVYNSDGTPANLAGAEATLLVTEGYGGTTLITKDTGTIGGLSISGNSIVVDFVQDDTTPPESIPSYAVWSLKLWVGGLALAEGRGPFVIGDFGVLQNTPPA